MDNLFSDANIHTLVADLLFPALILFTGIVTYVFFVRPALRETPIFKDLYDREAGVLYSVNMKLTGLKQKLTVYFISAITFILAAHDEIAPLVTQAGVDPTLILPKVPSWVWPMVTLLVLWLLQRFRNVADRAARANAEALIKSGQPLAAPAPGLPTAVVVAPVAPISPDLTNLPPKVQ